MTRVETWLNCDISKAVKVQHLKGNFFTADIGGNVIYVDVYDGTTPVALSGGTVVANIIRDNDTTIVVSGSIESGNRCKVILPESAYAVPGVVSIIIKLTNGTITTTLAALVGIVLNSTTGTLTDPGTTIPSLADYTSLVTRTEAAADIIDGLSTNATLIAGDRWKCSVTLTT